MKQPKPNRSRRRVLVIDDELAIHMLVKARLVDEGVEVHTALGGAAGLDASFALLPDVILLDVEMPEIDGFEVCRRLKADSKTQNIQVIFLSADTSTAQKTAGLDLGAVDYISKPFDPAELRARVRASLRTKSLMDLLATRALIDGLTGLWNRAFLQERLESELARARRYGSDLSLILLDIDRFKSINDRYGHPFGDHVLCEVAAALTLGCREEDSVCRYGGEEFAIVASGSPMTGSLTLAERLRDAIERTHLTVAETPVVVTASFGVAAAGKDSAAGLMERVDRALYQAKQTGRNRVVADGEAARQCA